MATGETRTVVNEAQDSITLTRGMKGQYGWEIKPYFQTEYEHQAIGRIALIDTALRNKFVAVEE